MTDTTNALRAQFERWADANGYGPKFRESMFAAYEAGAALAAAQPEAKVEEVGEVYVVHHPEDWGRYEAHDEVRIKWTGPKLGRNERVTVYAARPH